MALRRPFEGKGRQLVWAYPDLPGWGFFMGAASLAVDDWTPSSPVEEAWKREASRGLPQPCPPLSAACTPCSLILPPGVNAQHAVEAEERMLTALVSTARREHGGHATRPLCERSGWIDRVPAGLHGRGSRAVARSDGGGDARPRGVWVGVSSMMLCSKGDLASSPVTRAGAMAVCSTSNDRNKETAPCRHVYTTLTTSNPWCSLLKRLTRVRSWRAH